MSEARRAHHQQEREEAPVASGCARRTQGKPELEPSAVCNSIRKTLFQTLVKFKDEKSGMIHSYSGKFRTSFTP
jgi:hypothetical protein